VSPDDLVLDRALDFARVIAGLPALAARQIKEVALAGADMPLDAALTMERKAFWLMFGTPDQQEGMAAFLEKRPPVFNAT
jgi:enoyl-CoA hydratase/carnithine racemase